MRDERTIDASVYDDRTFNALTARQDWTLAVSPQFMMRWGADVARERADYVYSNDIVRDSAGTRQPDGVRPQITYTSATDVAITTGVALEMGCVIDEPVRSSVSALLATRCIVVRYRRDG